MCFSFINGTTTYVIDENRCLFFFLERIEFFFSLDGLGDSVNIFEDISKTARLGEEKKDEQPSDNADLNLAEEQKPLFEVSFLSFSFVSISSLSSLESR